MFARVAKLLLVILVACNFVLITQPASSATGLVERPISASEGFTCAIRQSDTVYCVGKSDYGQLGFTLAYPVSDPTAVPGLGPAVSVTTGTRFACSIGTDGYGYCWGDDSLGQLGTSVSGSQAKRIDLNQKLIDLQAGSDYACALTVSSEVYCWGTLLSSDTFKYNSALPIKITELSNVSAIAVGDRDVCAITQSVNCFGTINNSQIPSVIPNSLGATAIALGLDFGCFIQEGIASCFGDNSQGQLGRGNKDVSSISAPVADLPKLTGIFIGGQTACAVSESLINFCWGDNEYKQISVAAGDQATRIPSTFLNAVSFAISRTHLCALNRDSTISCSGDNSSTQTGLLASTEKPVGSANNDLVLSVSAGSTQTCVITKEYKLRCWGSFEPVISPETKFREVAVGSVSACAIGFDNRVYCWGANGSGQLGDNSNKSSQIPVAVQGMNFDVLKIEAGFRHFCAIASASRLVYCWGDNLKDQLGFTGADAKTAMVVPGVASALSISLGDYHSCVLNLNYQAFCWGDNSKKQIQNSSSLKLPLTELTSSQVSEVAAGGNNTCFIFATGADSKKMTCIGDNSESQAPGMLVGTFEKVSVGGNSVCANSLGQNRLVCFGSNIATKLGRLGAKSSTPSEITNNGFASNLGIIRGGTVSVGLQHTCYVLSDGNLLCWGSNSNGQLASSFGFPDAFKVPTITISGKSNIGERLSVVVGNLNGASYQLQWYRFLAPSYSNAIAVPGATGASIDLPVSEVNRTISVGLRLSRWGVTSEEYFSTQTSKIGSQLKLLLTPTPSISGKNKVGSRLSVRAGRWETGVKLSYQWFRGTTAISGAKGTSYQLTAKDVGKQIYVQVTGVKIGLPKSTVRSPRTAKVVN